MRGRAVVVAAVVAWTSSAQADDANLVYVEAGGKAGLYGVGYERVLTSRLAIGAAASFAVVRDQQLTTVSPYLHLRVLGTGRHRLFTELGASFVHSRIPSPVDDWDGMTDSGGGGFASLGWERDGEHIVVRTAASVVVGEGGLAPWVGILIGVKP